MVSLEKYIKSYVSGLVNGYFSSGNSGRLMTYTDLESIISKYILGENNWFIKIGDLPDEAGTFFLYLRYTEQCKNALEDLQYELMKNMHVSVMIKINFFISYPKTEAEKIKAVMNNLKIEVLHGVYQDFWDYAWKHDADFYSNYSLLRQ